MQTRGQGTPTAALRLGRRPTEMIERSKPVHFTFDGRRVSGYEGDTICSALWADNVRLISRSFKYHRPRAPFSFDGGDPNALVQIDDSPNVRAAAVEIREGMDVRPQNVHPTLRWDMMAVTATLRRFLPVGFYYKAFHSRRLWPFYERLLRRMGGLGRLDPSSLVHSYDKQNKHADVIVVGGGPAGLSAACAAAERNARVIVIEQEAFLGGHLRYQPGELGDRAYFDVALELIDRISRHDNIEVLPGAVAIGYYHDHWVPAFTERRLYKIRGGSVVVATGALNRTLVFTRNDAPGILTGRGAARLLNLYAVLPGRNVVVVSAGDDALRLALDLHQAGSRVTVADEREASESRLAERLRSAGVPVRWRHTISAAHGRRRVTAASLLPLERDGSLPGSAAAAVRVACDTLVLAVGYTPNSSLLYQSRSRLSWNDSMRQMLPVELSRGLYAAGDVCGTHDVETALLEGRIAGAGAASHCGYGKPAGNRERTRYDALKSQLRPQTTAHVSVPGPGDFRFVDLSEDVTEKDLYGALAEGYDSIELLKRYSTISMGPDQGRYSSITSVLLTARAQKRSVQQTGTTTSRPPLLPIKMGALQGRSMEPVKRTPLHHWHERRGCTWSDAGQWKRVASYNDEAPGDQVRRVRRNAGVLDLSSVSKFRLYGRDAMEVLDRLCTNRWDDCPVGAVRYGLLCNEAGVVVDDFLAARLDEDDVYVLGAKSPIPENVARRLQTGWNLDVHVVDVSSQQSAILAVGPQSQTLLERVVEDIDLSDGRLPAMSARACRVADVDALLLETGFAGEDAWQVHCPAGWAERVWSRLLERGRDMGVKPFGWRAHETLRLEAGKVEIGKDTDSRSSPLAANLGGMVDMDKPDFVGKAAVARKRKAGFSHVLIGFEMVDASIVPPEGNLLVNRRSDGGLSRTGWVTSSCFSPTLEKPIGMAWVDYERRAPGGQIRIRIDGRLYDAGVVSMPFYERK